MEMLEDRSVHRGYFSIRKIRLLLRVLVLLAITIGLMVIVRLAENDYVQAGADMLFLCVTLLGYIKLKKDYHAYKTVIRIVFFSAITASLFLLRNHPDIPVRFIWFSTIVYMIYYLFDRKEALYWIGTITVVLLGLFFMDMESFALRVTDFFIWVFNMMIVLMISHWYATIEEESTSRLLYVQNRLSEEVDKKTRELERRTKELELLNEHLEERVREELKKNRDQQQMLYRQARYVQMGEVLSMIAHQWRQPLNAVASTLSSMQVSLTNGLCDVESFLFKTKRMEGYVLHLSRTIDDFKHFFSEEKEKCNLTLDGIIDDAMELMGPVLEEAHIDVKIEGRCQCIIHSYPNEILHVVLNLLTNAKDAMVINRIQKRHIYIRMFHSERSIFLEIEDSAGGIDEAIMEKIFDPYFTTKGESGTGLGLYMSKQIIERHCQGVMEVENGRSGALFRLIFPIVSEG